MDVRLVLVSQAKVYGQVLSPSPVVLHKSAKIELADSGLGLSGRDRELSCAAAGRAYLRRGQTARQALLRDLKNLNAGEVIRIPGAPAAGKCPGAAEVLRRNAVNVYATKTGAELDRMQAERQRRVVIQFPAIVRGRRFANLGPAARERVLHIDGRNRIVRCVARNLMRELETRLVDCARIENRSLSQTKSLLRAERAILARAKRESAGACRVTAVLVFIARHQRVVLVDLIIEPRTKLDATVGQGHRLGKRNDVEARIEDRRIDDSLIVNIAFLKVEKEG